MTTPLTPAVATLLRDVRRRWSGVTVARAAVLGIAAALVSAIALATADLAVPLPASAREALRWLPLLLLVGSGARAGLTLRRATPHRLALLAQEHDPSLGNRLVTALELGASPSPVQAAFLAELERSLARTPRPTGPARLRRPLAVAAGALALAGLGAALFPGVAAESLERWLHPRDTYPQAWRERRAAAAGRVAELPPPAIGELRWTVTPPPYATLPPVHGRGDAPLVALPGSSITIRGHRSDRWDAIRVARAGGADLPVTRLGDEWEVALRVGAEERGITVEAATGGAVVARRTLPISVRPDLPPDVRLGEPRADLVLARPAGRVTIAASASDDLGVADLRLTWSRTRGSGETFEYVDGSWALPGVRPGRQTAGSLMLDIASLALQPGDVLHLRAVARDRNDVTGPGESVSRTRIIRIARPEELDQVNTDVGFPMELPENPLLSQRMIVIRTERLRDRAAALGPVELRRQAADLAREQARLRERVGEQVFTRATGAMQDPFADLSFTETSGAHAHEEDAEAAPPRSPAEVLEAASEATGQGTAEEIGHRHDASPILDVNVTLQRIYDLMWSSERALSQADPADALPHQYAALRLIQEMRRAERRFPRGAIAVDVVDVAAARGGGKLDGAAPAARSAGVPLRDRSEALAALEAAATSVRRADRQGSLALSALAARLLATPGIDGGVVDAVSRAADAAASGDAPGMRRLLVRARLGIAPPEGARRPALPSARDAAAAEYFRRLGGTR